MKTTGQIVSEHMRLIGAKGGASTSQAKRDAGKINAAKALAARLAKSKNKLN